MKNIHFALCFALLIACSDKDSKEEIPTSITTADLKGEGLPEAIATSKNTQWIVSTANPLATEAGAQILRKGGSAADAAVTVQTVLGLVEPQSSGLGGGAFMLYYDAQAKVITAYDGREAAPLAATPDMFMNADGTRMGFREAILSGKAVGVPATVALLDLAQREHGRLEWANLFDEPVRLATEGFAIPPRLATALPRSAPILANDEMARSIFLTPEGEPRTEGEIIKNQAYADSVLMIAENGAGAFYSGDFAQAIVDRVNQQVGEPYMTLEDIAEYEPISREAACGLFRDYNICTMSPPSSALAMIQILGKLEANGLPETPTGGLWADYSEAGRLAYADRAKYLGDPYFMGSPNITSEEVVAALLDPAYLQERAKLIGASAALQVAPGDPLKGRLELDRATAIQEEVPGTSHFSIRDSYGNIVSMTGTIEGGFGSHIMVGGMFLNNELTDFSFRPEIDGKPVVNAVGFAKRPRSSMTPTIVLDKDGNPVIAIGSAGGANIIGHVTKTLLLALGYDLPLQEAVDAPHVTTRVDAVYLEDNAPAEILETLEAYGAPVKSRELNSSLHGFRLDGVAIDCAADSRRDGSCLMGN